MSNALSSAHSVSTSHWLTTGAIGKEKNAEKRTRVANPMLLQCAVSTDLYQANEVTMSSAGHSYSISHESE